MEYVQYGQPPNEHFRVPHLHSASPILPPNSSPQPYTYKQYPDQAPPILLSQAQNYYQQRSGQYQPMGYPQYAVPGVGMPSPYGISLFQAAAMATAAASGISSPYPMYPNTDIPQGVAPRIIRGGHGHEAEGAQNANDKNLRRRTSHNEVERRQQDNIKERIQARSLLTPTPRLGEDEIKNRLQKRPDSQELWYPGIRRSFDTRGIQGTTNDIGSSPTANDNAPARELMLDNAEESPLYVNAKQFHRILKRRVARQKLEEQLGLTSRRDRENGSNSATRRLDILSEAATPTKPLPLTSQTLNKDLPIGIKGKKLNASADTGSDECGMPKDIADHLGLKVRCAPSDIKEFEIGNGRKIQSIGRTTVDCSFWNEPGKKLRCVFYVFERLIVPLIMGRDFLERTDTLTQHEDRLVDRAPRTGPCRVMHLSRPKRRMRCYIDSDLVEANPDTGAEMELVSPDFIQRKGYVVDAPDAAHEVVQFVDGSTARTQGQVTVKFEAYGDAFQEAVPSKARYRTFYVLDGLTTDILLGEDLLYSINAFTEHTSSFVDLDDFGMPVELKGIVWLDRAEQRLARIFGGDLPGSSATPASESAGIDTQSRMQRFTSLIGKATGARTQSEAIRTARRELDFERDMDNRDARENARQEAADLRIDRFPPSQRATAEEQEERLRQAFDDDQRQRRQQHEATLAAAVHHVPMA